MAPTSRRSGRSFPSPSISKSPDSDRPKDPTARPKRLKLEDIDPGVDGHAPSIASSASSASNGRAKRKPKDKDKDKDRISEKDRLRTDDPPPEPVLAPDAPQPVAEEEESGVTRCICGREDDPDAGEFMVQCETCKVWQHGLCMGYDSEAQLHDDDYYCEQCRPDFHTEYLKKSRRKARHSSTTSHPATAPLRQSRSHSPSFLKQPSKRRNTMNSRDAAFDENLKEILETTAAEAGATHDPPAAINGNGHPEPNEESEPVPANRKKRKRTEDDAPVKKRTRSASSASDRQMTSVIPRDDSPPLPSKTMAAPKAAGRRRGGRKAVVHELVVSLEGEEVSLPAPTKRGPAGRAKGPNASKRTPASAAPTSMLPDHPTRRTTASAPNGHPSSAAADSRTYRTSHAYAVSQQPMFTSWNLPDYLAHLEEILPSDTPQPLQVVGGGSTSRAGSVERTLERGVKVKWPSKRMSVGDMNKRVRALVEWVGREQASASERGKRKEALENALREELTKEALRLDGEQADDAVMAVDASGPVAKYDASQGSAAMTMMEELMEELIRFQERFGPGSSKRERRAG
ncbi:hypothetical protein B0H15DRAFT_849143 [Mycena belliarum]|uniref:PHD-type domain-containing protein n=1 Tax=Mycena belliarum TaxID=1033014 RepID=A0AAD6U3C6_9AGAR|nr:hypothetical protein B0H15DRAFT_849143 [Mycena belliae]